MLSTTQVRHSRSLSLMTVLTLATTLFTARLDAQSWARLFMTFVVVWLSGCGWERKTRFESPSPGTLIEVQQPFPANGWGLRLELKSKGATMMLYQLRGDVFLDFVDVAWAQDGNRVAIFTCGTPPIRLAYSLVTGHNIPFQGMESVLATKILRDYHLDEHRSGREIFDWACSDEGKRRFLEVHPEAVPR